MLLPAKPASCSCLAEAYGSKVYSCLFAQERLLRNTADTQGCRRTGHQEILQKAGTPKPSGQCLLRSFDHACKIGFDSSAGSLTCFHDDHQDKVSGGKQEKEKAAKRFSEISAGTMQILLAAASHACYQQRLRPCVCQSSQHGCWEFTSACAVNHQHQAPGLYLKPVMHAGRY